MMKTLYKRPSVIAIFSLIVAMFVFLIFSGNSINAFNLSNASFYIALPTLAIGIMKSVFKSGAFDFFQKSMRDTFKRKKIGVDQPEKKALSEVFSKKNYFFLEIGVFFLVLSLICLILI